MRTEKELWEVVLSRPDLFTHGLCSWIKCINCDGLLSEEENRILLDVLETNLPPKIYSIYPFLSPDYSFPCKELLPRIDWIKNRIEQL